MKTVLKPFFITLIYILMFYFIYNVYSNLVFFDLDDLNATISPYPLWREENGRYVFNILSRIFCIHLPNLLNIHIQDGLTTIGRFVYTITQLALFSIIGLFSVIKTRKTTPNQSVTFVLFLLFGLLCFYNNYACVFDLFFSTFITFQYGYLMATTFSLGFLLLIYENLLNQKLFDKKYMLRYVSLPFAQEFRRSL